MIKNFTNEKIIYERENQIEAFKTTIKPIMGRSFREDEFANIIKLKNDEFENAIRKRFNDFRNKRIKAITETTNVKLEKRVFLQKSTVLEKSACVHNLFF